MLMCWVCHVVKYSKKWNKWFIFHFMIDIKNCDMMIYFEYSIKFCKSAYKDIRGSKTYIRFKVNLSQRQRVPETGSIRLLFMYRSVDAGLCQEHWHSHQLDFEIRYYLTGQAKRLTWWRYLHIDYLYKASFSIPFKA